MPVIRKVNNMADFEQAFNKVVRAEGGWVNNPKDSGGETYIGVSRNNWPKWAGWRIIDEIKASLTVQPTFGTSAYRNWVGYLDGLLKASLTLQTHVKSFYLANFWGKLGEINDQRVSEEVFDKHVNCGGVALKWLQRAAGVTADGVIGPKSIEAINSKDPAALLWAFNAAAKDYYEDIIDRRPDQEQFRKSWMSRLKNYDGSKYA